MHERLRTAEIIRLRGAIAAGSLDYRTVHRKLAELLLEDGKHLAAAQMAIAAADLAWAIRPAPEVLDTQELIAFAQRVAPKDDFGIRRACQLREELITRLLEDVEHTLPPTDGTFASHCTVIAAVRPLRIVST
ncbi:MAG: hypothetical protein Q7S96_04970 [bacterium]|nr:hypothetical protein [bacterium]